jgi:hypothetical protein
VIQSKTSIEGRATRCSVAETSSPEVDVRPAENGQDFVPHPFLKNPHAMTVFPRYWQRRDLLAGIPVDRRLFAVSRDSHILGLCHWQPDSRDRETLLLVHGLEGCAESHYMLGLTQKAWRSGFNVVRLNQRNCGGTEHLTPTLYHGGLSNDVSSVVEELSSRDRLSAIWVAGYSMGGNLVLRMAGHMGASCPALKGVLAVCPNIDPEACVQALEERRNWIYHYYFVSSMKARLRRKATLFPGKFNLSPLAKIRTLRQFDATYTAPDGGYASAEDYYERTGARHVIRDIAVPALIVTAQDDPFIPYHMFTRPGMLQNPFVNFVAPRWGGHCGFFQRRRPEEDAYWAENRLIEFIAGGISLERRAEAIRSKRTPAPN